MPVLSEVEGSSGQTTKAPAKVGAFLFMISENHLSHRNVILDMVINKLMMQLLHLNVHHIRGNLFLRRKKT